MKDEKTLAQLMHEDEEKEEHQQKPSAPIAMEKDDANLPPSRRGKRPLTAWVNSDAHRYVRMIAADDDISLEQVVTDALNKYFRDRGMPPIA